MEFDIYNNKRSFSKAIQYLESSGYVEKEKNGSENIYTLTLEGEFLARTLTNLKEMDTEKIESKIKIKNYEDKNAR